MLAGHTTATAEQQACAALSVLADLAAHAPEEAAKQLLAAGVLQACTHLWHAHAGQGVLRPGVLHALPRLASTGDHCACRFSIMTLNPKP